MVIGLILVQLMEVMMKKKMTMVMLKMMKEKEMEIYGMFEAVVVIVGMAAGVGGYCGQSAAGWMVAGCGRRKGVSEIEEGE